MIVACATIHQDFVQEQYESPVLVSRNRRFDSGVTVLGA